MQVMQNDMTESNVNTGYRLDVGQDGYTAGT